MTTIETATAGSRKIYCSSNDGVSDWTSRLYVNNGQTATLTCAKHKRLGGAKKWATKTMAAYLASVS